MSNFYEAREQLMLNLGLNTFTPEQERYADTLLRGVGGFMDRWTGKVLESTTHTRERYQAGKYERLTLNNYPVTTLTAIYADDDTTAISSSNYKLVDAESGIIYKGSGWNDATYYYEITYIAGFDATNYPAQWDDLVWIQAELCSILWHRGGKIAYSSDNWNFDNLQGNDMAFQRVLQDRLSIYKRRTAGNPL